MKKLWLFTRRYAFAYKWWYLLGFLFVILTQVLTVMIIERTKQAIDAVNTSSATQDTVVPFVTAIVTFACILVVIRICSRHFIFTPGRLIEYKIRKDYFQRLLFLDRSFYAEHEVGDLISRCSNDIGHVRAVYGYVVLQIVNVAASLGFGFSAMLQMSWQITALLAIPMLVCLVVTQISISFAFKYWRKANLQLGELSSFCLASYKGVSVIQGYHAEPHFSNRFHLLNDEYLATNAKITQIRSLAFPLVRSIGGVCLFLVLWFLGPEVIAQEMTIGEVTAFIGYISMVMPPLLSLGWMVNVFNRALPAIDRLDGVLLAPEPANEGSENLPYHQRQTLRARNLHFHYSSSPDTEEKSFSLNNISFVLPPGKKIGIVGPTGSGKTTLVETILRLNSPSAGTLFLGDHDATTLKLADYRRYFSVVPQVPFLFSSSLRQNLSLALPEQEWDDPNLDEKLYRYLEKAGFVSDLESLPEGLDTLVGEKGVMLSGGQRQRVALARGLLKQAQIYILDDVLSAVDHETEQLIIRNLQSLGENNSFVIISHRVSAVQWCDEILVLEQGRIVQRGTHQQLANQTGFYREIFEYQSSES